MGPRDGGCVIAISPNDDVTPQEEHAARQREAFARGANPGMMPVHRWYLRHDAPWDIDAPPPRDDLMLMLAEDCTVAFYRFLYDTVGEDWLWFGQRAASPEALKARRADPAFEIHVLYRTGTPAGFMEIDHSDEAETELAYVGILPHATGQGLGTWMFAAACHAALERRRLPLTINTCTLDSAGGLALYRRFGFEVEREIDFEDPDPRATGLIRESAAPHVPRF